MVDELDDPILERIESRVGLGVGIVGISRAKDLA